MSRQRKGDSRLTTDSIEIEKLRFAFKRSYHRQGIRAPNACARRLGTYAAVERMLIFDFGSHSVRWVRMFSAAYQEEKKYQIRAAL